MDQATLLTLNDYCLLEISKFLEERDCINLANTCHRLRNIAISAIASKYKKIAVQVRELPVRSLSNYPFFRHVECINKKTKAEVIVILSLVGENVESFKFIGASPFIYQILNEVPNLKELKIEKDFVISKLSDYFSKNDQLESIECQYEYGVFILLKMFPNLAELRIYDLPDGSIDRNETFNDLLSLKGLTKFSFTSLYNCNQLLIEIEKNLQLVELEIHALVTSDTFDIIKSFGNLKRLSMTQSRDTRSFVNVPENVVLPPHLQCIKFGGIEISCDCFLTMVKNLKLLNEFDIGDGYIVDGVAEFFPQRMGKRIGFNVVSRIVNELRVELSQRSFKLIYYDNYNPLDKPIYPHNLNLLTIVNSWFDRDEKTSGLITVYEQPKRKRKFPYSDSS